MPTSLFSDYTLLAIEAAQIAGKIIYEGFSTTYSIQKKPGHQNLVTPFDFASEKALINSIHARFPSHTILTEESGFIPPRQPIVSTDNFLWIIDPIDGTTNFTRSLPLFAVSIALYIIKKQEAIQEAMQETIPVCGVIYQPMTKELFVAEKGKGAYLNNKILQVSSVHEIKEAVIAVNFPTSSISNPTLNIKNLMQMNETGTTLRNLGSAALALAYVAAGKMDGFWMPYLFPWDFAAGKILIEEAFGKFITIGNENFSLQEPSGVLASNLHLHSLLLTYLYAS